MNDHIYTNDSKPIIKISEKAPASMSKLMLAASALSYVSHDNSGDIFNSRLFKASAYDKRHNKDREKTPSDIANIAAAKAKRAKRAERKVRQLN